MKKLTRKKGKIFGVCEGLSEYANIDATVIRIVFVLAAVYYGAGLIPYLILALIIPEE